MEEWEDNKMIDLGLIRLVNITICVGMRCYDSRWSCYNNMGFCQRVTVWDCENGCVKGHAKIVSWKGFRLVELFVVGMFTKTIDFGQPWCCSIVGFCLWARVSWTLQTT